MNKQAYQMVNLITFYRLITVPLLMLLLLEHQFAVFKYLLAVSFFTDAIDGWLARKFNVVSLLGARIDSVADDLTVLVAIIGVGVYRPDFIRGQWVAVIVLGGLYLLQNVLAIMRYRKPTSFHTYIAKFVAVLQGVFLVLFFFMDETLLPLFYTTAAITVIDLAEEILLTLILPQWEANVKGLYWVLKKRKDNYGVTHSRTRSISRTLMKN